MVDSKTKQTMAMINHAPHSEPSEAGELAEPEDWAIQGEASVWAHRALTFVAQSLSSSMSSAFEGSELWGSGRALWGRGGMLYRYCR